MENNMEIYQKVRSVPQEAQKTITGGRLKGYTDINPMWRIKVLTENFGICGIGWYYTIDKKWIEQVGDEAAAFVDISLYIKVDGEWSKPIAGTGGAMLASKERSGIYADDEAYKKATTDAISVACKQLGVGADVYWGKDRTKYDTKQSEPEKTAGGIYVQSLEKIKGWLKKKGVAEKDVCARLEIQSLDEMTQEQWRKWGDEYEAANGDKGKAD